jgi:uncharacterized protein (TIGR03000 family)
MIKQTTIAALAAALLGLMAASPAVQAQGRFQQYGSPYYDYWWYNGPSYFDWYFYHSPRYSYLTSPYYNGPLLNQYYDNTNPPTTTLRTGPLVRRDATLSTSPTYGSLVDSSQVRLVIRVPEENARVWLEEQPTQQRGTERVFLSPSLEPGQPYLYTVRASWMENGTEVNRVQKVRVEPGRQFVVNFLGDPTEEAPVVPKTAAPPPAGSKLRSTDPNAVESVRDRLNRNPSFPIR